MSRIAVVISLFILTSFAPADFYTKFAEAAVSLSDSSVRYVPGYFVIKYPNGDVPKSTGVCTDLVIRAYRKVGIDLQKEVHQDMAANFSSYPKLWGLNHTDSNIDHRRVPNLMTFFMRKKASLPITSDANSYNPGDIVCWKLNGKLTHIGIVTNLKNSQKTRFLIAHNIGNGQVVEDCLFNFDIIGHYRYKK